MKDFLKSNFKRFECFPGCYGVFDTVSSYKYHCDNCKHRSNEKKPLLSFAKRNTKGNAESTSQADSNGASFEILEGVQIKFLETPDKTEAGKETPSQIPLVVYESDSSPMKKTDANRTPKKNKRTQSSPETIMDTIESVIKSVCHDNDDLVASNDDEAAPASAGTSEELAQEHLEKVRDVLENNLETEEAPTEPHTELEFEAEAEPKKSRGKKAKAIPKAIPKARKKATKKAKKTTPKMEEEEPEADEQSVTETSREDIAENDESKDVPATSNPEEANEKKEVRKPTKKMAARRLLPSSDMETMKNAIISSRLRARPRSDTYAPPRRALRSRTKQLSESLDESKNVELEEMEAEADPSVVKDESMDEGEKVTPARGKKRKNDSPKSDAKKPKNDSTNDLGFNVTKTNKTIPKNASKKKNSTESKNEKAEDDAESEIATEESKSEPKPLSRRTSDVVEPVAPETSASEQLRRKTSDVVEPAAPETSPSEELPRRSSDHSEAKQPESASPSSIPIENSVVTDSSMESRQLQTEPIAFFDGSSQPTNELVECSRNEISTFDYDEQDEQSCTESYDSQESTVQPANSWAWDFLDQKSLGSIIDTVNEVGVR